jgi:hypothetical protein
MRSQSTLTSGSVTLLTTASLTRILGSARQNDGFRPQRLPVALNTCIRLLLFLQRTRANIACVAIRTTSTTMEDSLAARGRTILPRDSSWLIPTSVPSTHDLLPPRMLAISKGTVPVPFTSMVLLMVPAGGFGANPWLQPSFSFCNASIHRGFPLPVHVLENTGITPQPTGHTAFDGPARLGNV